MIGSLEEGLFDVKYTINVQNWNEVDCVVFEKVDVVVIVVYDSMKQFKDDVKWHLD